MYNRITVNSTLKSAEVLSAKKYSIKLNTPKTPLDKTLDNVHRKEDEFTKKEISSMETDTPIVDTSEIGCVTSFFIIFIIFFYLGLYHDRIRYYA